ncbi:MAG: CoA transferase [Myxococcales bacterium]|nr:CoA transferase [Myxococcales bacterium]
MTPRAGSSPGRAFRVIDFTRVLAGPWATQILGDQGFDVIKIEGPEGDETRRFLPVMASGPAAGESVYFACTNRNKRSVVLDLKTPAGVEAARRLVRTADVVVENFRPGVMQRLGLGDDTLRADNPGLVSVAIHAFGDGHSAEWATRAGYDLVLQSMGGIASLTGDPPRKAGPSIADLASAQVAVQAVLFGLLDRHRTGVGCRRVISMLDVQHHLLAYYASAWLNAATAPPAPSNAHPSIAPYNLYRCTDGWLAICCANDPLWEKLRAALDLPIDPLWGSLGGRVADRARLDGAIELRLGQDTVVSWDRRLAAAGVPCGPVLSVAASLAHPLARTMQLGPWEFPAPPLQPVAFRPPPRLGEHTAEVLAEVLAELDPE